MITHLWRGHGERSDHLVLGMSGKQEKQEASAGVGGSPDGKKWRDTVGGGDSRVFCVRPAANGPFRVRQSHFTFRVSSGNIVLT